MVDKINNSRFFECFSQALMSYKPGSTVIYDKAYEWIKEMYDMKAGMALMMADVFKVDVRAEYEEMIKSHAKELAEQIEQEFTKEFTKEITKEINKMKTGVKNLNDRSLV